MSLATEISTAETQLAEVRTAVTAVLGGQSYSIGGKNLTRADLRALDAREQRLIKRLSMLNARSARTNRVLASKTQR